MVSFLFDYRIVVYDNYNNVKLIIVGDGPEKHRIIDSAKKLKIFVKI
jgi:hypothetical protein